MEDLRFINVRTGEITVASKYAYKLCLDNFKKNGGKVTGQVHHNSLNKKELIELGLTMLTNNKDWERW